MDLLRGALDQLPHQAADVADEHIARAVRAHDGFAAGGRHRAAGLGPLIDGGVNIAHDHRERRRSRIFRARHDFRARHAGILDQSEVESRTGNAPVRDAPLCTLQADEARDHWQGVANGASTLGSAANASKYLLAPSFI